jgi:hypothetical protein
MLVGALAKRAGRAVLMLGMACCDMMAREGE